MWKISRLSRMLHQKWIGIGCYPGGVRYRAPYGANDMSETDVAQWFCETRLAPFLMNTEEKFFVVVGGVGLG